MADTVGAPGRHSDRRSWVVVALAVMVSMALVVVISTSTSGPGEHTRVTMPEEVVSGCPELGIAGPAAWEELSDRDFRAMVDEQVLLGSTWIRLSAVWKDVEPGRGVYAWDGLDQRVDAAVEAGLTPLMLIQTHPGWLGGFGERGSGAAGEFGRFAGEVAERYGDRVDAYEIWNEPNLARFWPDPDPDAYAELLAAAAPRIAAEDPGAHIVSAGLAPADNVAGYSLDDLEYLERLYETGVMRYADAVGMHPYSFPELPSGTSEWNAFRRLNEVKSLMVARGDGDKMIWLTEYGAPTGGDRGVSERDQADMVVEALRLTVADPRLGPIFMYTMHDIDLGAEESESYFGLMVGPGDPKPAFLDLRDAAGECSRKFGD
ncbi:glycoside hydrolase 5 family protein [Corynebacterium comes]|uniref:Glycoside hydrolase family 5 domain-containing protein n=1 Tax=Corynebacterium comes TaxID=2675218 RepID=A0A6B8VJY8_9CORY|nr:hypothetical protein [Corynebacterium comes]QGU05702.1 hypothetical protein CETAM_12355 [Corynebacterium comes]